MCRFVAANLAVLALVVLAAVAGAVAAGWSWWATALVAAAAFFGGGQAVERLAPGTRLLEWLGLAGR